MNIKLFANKKIKLLCYYMINHVKQLIKFHGLYLYSYKYR